MRVVALSVVLLWTSTVVGDPIWIETFDTGVGRFDQTMGPGDTRYISRQPGNLYATFIRDGANDRRYTELGETLNSTRDVFGFSFVIMPLLKTIGGYAASSIGCWNSSDDNSHNRLGINAGGSNDENSREFRITGNYADGTPIEVDESSFIEFAYFRTYFIDVVVDGPSHTISANFYQGTDATGELLGTLEQALDPGRKMEFDSLGMGGLDGEGQILIATIDDFAYTIPEAPTVVFLALGGSAILSRWRRWA